MEQKTAPSLSDFILGAKMIGVKVQEPPHDKTTGRRGRNLGKTLKG